MEMTGQESESGVAEFSPEQGLVVRHKGNAVLQTKTRVEMQTAGESRTFPMELELRVEFDMKLVHSGGRRAGG